MFQTANLRIFFGICADVDKKIHGRDESRIYHKIHASVHKSGN